MEWKLVITETGSKWISEAALSPELKDSNSVDVSALAHAPIRAERDDSHADSNIMSTETRERLSTLSLDDVNLHEALRKAGEYPAALCADKSQVTLAFHPNIITAYSRLQTLQGDLQQVVQSVAEGAEYEPKLLPEAVVKSEVRDLEDIRAGALEVENPTIIGQVLQRLDRNKLWDFAKKDLNMPEDPKWLDEATTSLQEPKQQNRYSQLEADKELNYSTPTQGQILKYSKEN
jgi:hypothetical protein